MRPRNGSSHVFGRQLSQTNVEQQMWNKGGTGVDAGNRDRGGVGGGGCGPQRFVCFRWVGWERPQARYVAANRAERMQWQFIRQTRAWWKKRGLIRGPAYP